MNNPEWRSLSIKLEATTLLSYAGLPGIDPSGQLSEEKIKSIKERVAPVISFLTEDNELKPHTQSSISPYEVPKDPKNMRRLGLIGSIIRGTSTTDESEIIFRDNATFFRGTTLGEVLVAAIVNNGYIISTSSYDWKNSPAVTQLTPYPTGDTSGAIGYAKGKSHELKTAQRIYEALQLESFGFTLEQVKNSILMSPVILRFNLDNERERLDNYGSAGTGTLLSTFAMSSPTPYQAAIPPMNITETTHAWQESFAQVFGFDIASLLKA